MRNRKHDSDSGISGSKLDLILLAFLYTYMQGIYRYAIYVWTKGLYTTFLYKT
jgi:hypothetical protein